MKTHIIQFIAGVLIFFLTPVAGISQEHKMDLTSPEIQEQVFNQIFNNTDLIDDFITQMQSNQDAMNYLMSKMMMKCCTDSIMCKTVTEKISEHDEILERLGKILLEKEHSNYNVEPKARYKHK